METTPAQIITYDREKVLGSGGYGTIFEGKWGEVIVAVKRVELKHLENSSKKGEKCLRNCNHPNVIKLFDSYKNLDFRLYALELCQASLDKVYLEDGDPKKYVGPLPSIDDMILQLATGQEYIHNNNLVHRDIKPANVLIWVDPKSAANQKSQNVERTVLMKWADFGLCKQTTDRGTFTMANSVSGTPDWFAPEILKIINSTSMADTTRSTLLNRRRGTNKSDIFSEGLVFAYILLGGKHLYDSDADVIANNQINFKNLALQHNWARPLILDRMLKTEPDKRLTAKEVVERLNFYSRYRQSMKPKDIIINQKQRSNIGQYMKTEFVQGQDIRKIITADKPDIYLLNLKRRSIAGINSYEVKMLIRDPVPPQKFHQNQPNKQNHKVILLFGEVGCNKRRLINGMANYILGIKFEDPLRFELIEEESEQSPLNPSPLVIKDYTFYHQDGMAIPYSITIVEIPVYQTDPDHPMNEKITDSFRQLFATRIFKIHAVCFVAGDEQLVQPYIFDSVASIFDETAKKRILLLITSADNLNAQDPPIVQALKTNNSQSQNSPSDDIIYYKFNCSALYASNQFMENEENLTHQIIWDMDQVNFQMFFEMLKRIDGIKPVTTPELTPEVCQTMEKAKQTFKDIKKKLKSCFDLIKTMDKSTEIVPLRDKKDELLVLLDDWDKYALFLESMTIGRNNSLEHPVSHLTTMRD